MQPQQIGVPFIMTQPVQPHLSMVERQSQQAWIILQQSGSFDVQVIVQPLEVISHLHMPIVRLHEQTIMPFIMQQTLHMPPAIMLQRFCTMLQEVGSSQTQLIFIPSATFSHVTVQRGTIR